MRTLDGDAGLDGRRCEGLRYGCAVQARRQEPVHENIAGTVGVHYVRGNLNNVVNGCWHAFRVTGPGAAGHHGSF